MSGGWPSQRSLDGGLDEIPLPAVAGRLWLCGKHLVGPDPDAAMRRVDATLLVCLTEPHELDARYPQYVAWLEQHRRADGSPSRAEWFPVPDLHAPPLDRYRPFLDLVVARLRAGDRVIVHCAAGIGRAGTTATAILLLLGAEPSDALAMVARHRPMAGPEAGAQQDVIDELSRQLGRTPARRT